MRFVVLADPSLPPLQITKKQVGMAYNINFGGKNSYLLFKLKKDSYLFILFFFFVNF